MEISTLQIFVEVMRQGSFTAVARDRNLDPSSISRTIAGLEKELGLRLFQRTTRRLSPTEAGTTYFERVGPLVEELQQAIEIATDVSGQPRGTLRVTASVSFGQRCLVPLLPQFRQQYPDLAIELLLTDAVLDLFAERIDVAIRLGILADSSLIAQRLMPTDYRVCASPHYLSQSGQLATPSDIARHACLRFPLAGFRSRWLFQDQAGKLAEIPVTGSIVISNALALQQCAIAGLGLALLPNWLIDAELQAGTLIDVFPDYQVTATEFNTAAWLVFPSRAYMPLKVRAFLDFLKTSILTESN
ncbi:MAG: LysR family transcriptional regulator [Leptolyngbya sp. SIOISBB]|nr:LysR family transcriptional regulator [Leptolyngbya sp. SIOISBB]